MLARVRRALGSRLRAIVADVVQDAVGRERESQLFDIARERQRLAVNATAQYVGTRMLDAEVLADRHTLLRFAVSKAAKRGLYLEFGVATGATVNLIASLVPARVYGFDSFEGLPEPWPGYLPKGAFRQDRLPVVSENVELVVGMFEHTLPQFLKRHGDALAFVHIDCDLYTSTRTVLGHLAPRLLAGTIVVFDEYFNYPGWEEGEHRAFRELVGELGLSYTYLAYTNSQQVALRIN